MALSDEAKKIWEEIAKIAEEAVLVLSVLKDRVELSLEVIAQAENYVNTINSAVSQKHTTDKQVKEIETVVRTEYANLLRIKEKSDSEIENEHFDEETESETDDESSDEEVVTIVYVGPTLRKFGITSNTSFIGTKIDTYNFFKKAIEAVPEVKKMLVPVSELTEKQKLLKAKNNAFSKIYKEIQRKIKEV